MGTRDTAGRAVPIWLARGLHALLAGFWPMSPARRRGRRQPAPTDPPPVAPPRDAATGRFAGEPDPAQEAAAAETLAEVAALSRAPFRRVLARYLQAIPDLEALAAQAERNPDRWAQGLAIAGRLAGYTEKLDVEVSGALLHLQTLSDAELEAKIAALTHQLHALPPARPSLPPRPPHPAP